MSQEIQLAAEAGREVASTTEAVGGLGALGINVKIFIAQLINFVIVVLVLWQWAYKPIVKILDERREKIERSVKQAEEVERRIQALDRQEQEVLARVRAEAAQALDQASAQAQERKQTLLRKAKEEVQHVIAQGKKQLDIEKEQMILDARDDIAAMAVEAARKILTEDVDETKAQKLAMKVIKSVKV